MNNHWICRFVVRKGGCIPGMNEKWGREVGWEEGEERRGRGGERTRRGGNEYSESGQYGRHCIYVLSNELERKIKDQTDRFNILWTRFDVEARRHRFQWLKWIDLWEERKRMKFNTSTVP